MSKICPMSEKQCDDYNGIICAKNGYNVKIAMKTGQMKCERFNNSVIPNSVGFDCGVSNPVVFDWVDQFSITLEIDPDCFDGEYKSDKIPHLFGKSIIAKDFTTIKPYLDEPSERIIL